MGNQLRLSHKALLKHLNHLQHSTDGNMGRCKRLWNIVGLYLEGTPGQQIRRGWSKAGRRCYYRPLRKHTSANLKAENNQYSLGKQINHYSVFLKKLSDFSYFLLHLPWWAFFSSWWTLSSKIKGNRQIQSILQTNSLQWWCEWGLGLLLKCFGHLHSLSAATARAWSIRPVKHSHALWLGRCI